MNEQLTKIAEVLADSEANGSGICRKRSAYSRRVAHLSVVELGGDAGANAAAKLFKAAPKLLAALEALVCYDSYSTEYDGCMYDICPSCGAKDGDHKLRCEFEFARAAIREATE